MMSTSVNDDKNDIIKKLSNFLKLPKAQRWICCEWFYSDIDKVIFESENDFSFCLKQSFPRLKTNKLKRKEWCALRSMIGKPRRCSDAFFREERLMLEEKRQKIRLIQQRKVSEKELNDFKDLPQEIPFTLSIGHRVYSHISYPEEGVFLGTIAAVDPCDHTYRVVFDRASLGSQTVNDFEIKSVQPVQTIPIKAYIQTYRPKITPSQSQSHVLTPHKSLLTTPTSSQLFDDLNINNQTFAASLLLQSDPMIGISGSPFKLDCLSGLNSQLQTPINSTSNQIVTNTSSTNGMLGGFPVRLLVAITRLNKILNVKRDYVAKLNQMNQEAERLRANNESITKEFQTNYAILVLDLDRLNKDLSEYLNGVQRYCEELAPGEFNKLITIESDQSPDTTLTTTITNIKFDDLKHKLLNDSTDLVNKLNKRTINQPVDTQLLEDSLNKINLDENASQSTTTSVKIKSKHSISLIIKLTNLLFQLREFIYATQRLNQTNHQQQQLTFLPNCTQLINESIQEIKSSLIKDSNIDLFVDRVQVHINHIQSSLCQYNKLNAFKLNDSNETTNSLANLISHELENLNENSTIINDYECDDHDDDDDDDDDDHDDQTENILDLGDNPNESDENDYDVDESDSENIYNHDTTLKTAHKQQLKRKRLDSSSHNKQLKDSNAFKKVICSLSSPSTSPSSSLSNLSTSNINKNNTNSNSTNPTTNNNNIGIST